LSVLGLVAFFAVLSVTNLGNATLRCVGYTSTRYVGYFCSSALVPSVRLPAYCAMFLASTVRRGLSPAKGLGRMPSPALKLAGAVVMPPV
jgi:hypothetical protein